MKLPIVGLTFSLKICRSSLASNGCPGKLRKVGSTFGTFGFPAGGRLRRFGGLDFAFPALQMAFCENRRLDRLFKESSWQAANRKLRSVAGACSRKLRAARKSSLPKRSVTLLRVPKLENCRREHLDAGRYLSVTVQTWFIAEVSSQDW